MKTTFFKSRCLVCWKNFEVPLLPDSSYGDSLYYDKQTKKFSYFNWFDNTEIEKCIKEFLSKNPKLQFSNDNTKDNIALQIVGFIANGNKECILRYRCPRCGLKFNSISNTKTGIKEIETLNFTDFLSLDNSAQQQYILNRIKKSNKLNE